MDPFFIGALVLLLAYFFFFRPKPDIDGPGARALVKEGALLLDVRTDGEFSAGHLTGAKHIPLHDLEHRAKKELDKSRTIVVYCRSGARSGQAKKLLAGLGFEKIRDLGGMSRW